MTNKAVERTEVPDGLAVEPRETPVRIVAIEIKASWAMVLLLGALVGLQMWELLTLNPVLRDLSAAIARLKG